MTAEERNARVEQFLPLVDKMAARLASRLPRHVDRDDLHSAGVLGLIDAAGRFDEKVGATFAGYAGIRIRGAMLDELRRLDPSPRRVRVRARQLARATQEATTTLGRPPTGPELAATLGISAGDLEEWQAETGVVLLSLDREHEANGESNGTLHDMLPDPGEGTVEGLERREQMDAMVEMIRTLPKRTQKVLALTLVEGATLIEVAEALGCTESRVCQIKQDAIALLRARLGRQSAGLPAALAPVVVEVAA